MPEDVPADFTGFAAGDQLEANQQEPIDGVVPWTEVDQSPDYFDDLDDDDEEGPA